MVIIAYQELSAAPILALAVLIFVIIVSAAATAVVSIRRDWRHEGRI